MSDETAVRLREAEAIYQTKQAIADTEKNECLIVIARELPSHVEELARRTAHSQPDVAKALGVEGTKSLRKDLADAVVLLAAEIKGAAGQIDWPHPQSEHSSVSTRDIHSALFNFLCGKRVDSLAAILKVRGFAIHDDNVQRSQGLVHPQSLYNEARFSAVAEALNSLATAERALSTARADDDRAAVDSLWADE